MNTVTRMVLISEDQYRRGCVRSTPTKRLLNKNLAPETKVNYLNNALAKKDDNFPNLKQDDNSKLQVHAILSAIVKSLQNGESTTGGDAFSTANTTKVEGDDGDSEQRENENTSKTIRGYEERPMSSFYPNETIIRPPLTASTPGPSRVNELKKRKQKDQEHDESSIQDSSMQKLKDALRGIPGLLDPRDRIKRDEGDIIRGSRLKKIVKWLQTSDTYQKIKPNGCAYVIDKIIDEYPLLLRYVKNKEAHELYKRRQEPPSTLYSSRLSLHDIPKESLKEKRRKWSSL